MREPYYEGVLDGVAALFLEADLLDEHWPIFCQLAEDEFVLLYRRAQFYENTDLVLRLRLLTLLRERQLLAPAAAPPGKHRRPSISGIIDARA